MFKRPLFSFYIFVTGGLFFFLCMSARAQTTSQLFPQDLTIGDSGSEVFALQSFLISQGYLNTPSPTGYFGSLTASAVAEWQTAEQLPATGYFGPMSRMVITGQTTAPSTPTPPPITSAPGGIPVSASPTGASPSPSLSFDRNLTVGARGNDVSSLQSFLITQGYLAVPSPTGYFGSLTASAVAEWQTAEQLPATGYFGPMSRAAITSASIAIPNLTPVTTINPPANTTNINPSAPSITTGNSGGGGGGGAGGGGGGGTPNIPTAAPSPSVTTKTSAPSDVTPPSVSIASPAASSTVAGVVSVTVNASDNSGIAKVEFYLDGSLQTADTAAPYTWSWQTTSDKNGIHTLTVKAYDTAGNVATSPAKSVTVKNTSSDATPPTTPSGFGVAGTTATTISLSWAPSADPTVADQVTSGMAGYKIYRGASQISTITQTSFVDSNLIASTTYAYTVVAYDKAGNVSASSTVISAKTAAAPSQVSSVTGFGMSVGENLMALSNADLNADMDDLVSLGVTWLRFDIQWDHVQPNNATTYSWVSVDKFVAAAVAHHINLLPVISYTPAWARSSSCAAQSDRCPPSSAAAYAKFVQAAVNRYAPQGISAWEIWNEPNLAGSWQPGADASAYSALLKATYPLIKTIQPNAIVITGGMGPAATGNGDIAPIDFLTELYAQNAKSYFDAVGFHPYSYPAMPSFYATWNAWSQMASTTPSLRSVMAANGDGGKQIWATEYGAPTNGPGEVEASANDTKFTGGPDHVTESVQSAMLTDAISSFKKFSWAGPLFWYSYNDIGIDPSTVENFFGVVRNDGSPKPAYSTLKYILTL